MEEKTLRYAEGLMRQMSDRVKSVDRLPIALPDNPEKTKAFLLGWYGTLVRSRDREFLSDECTISKIEKVAKWMHESTRRGLLLCGTLGNGKTTMLRTLKYLFGTKAVYMESQAAYDYYRKNQSLPSVNPSVVLLIDDLGAEPPTYNEFGQTRYPLTELLLSRYRLNATTVIATNLNFDEIGQTYGDRLQDRMREMFSIITYTEESYRKSLK